MHYTRKNYELLHQVSITEKSLYHTDVKQKVTNEELVRNIETSLFDISGFNCKDLDNCSCEIRRQVPHRNLMFLQDKRTAEKMVIGNIRSKTGNIFAQMVARKVRVVLVQRGIVFLQQVPQQVEFYQGLSYAYRQKITKNLKV